MEGVTYRRGGLWLVMVGQTLFGFDSGEVDGGRMRRGIWEYWKGEVRSGGKNL